MFGFLLTGFRRYSTPASDLSLVTCIGTAAAAGLTAIFRPRFVIPEFSMGMMMVSGLYFILAAGYWLEKFFSERRIETAKPEETAEAAASPYSVHAMRRNDKKREERALV